jgi:hypothetical protein
VGAHPGLGSGKNEFVHEDGSALPLLTSLEPFSTSYVEAFRNSASTKAAKPFNGSRAIHIPDLKVKSLTQTSTDLCDSSSASVDFSARHVRMFTHADSRGDG